MDFNLSLFDLINYPIDYNMVSKTYFNSWSLMSAFIFGIILYILLFPIYYNLGNFAARKFHKKYPDEKILYIIKTSPTFMFIMTLLVGGFWGMCLYPFLIFENLTYIKPVHETTWWFYFILFLSGIIALLVRFSIIYIISDQNIRLINPFKLFDNWAFKKDYFIPISSIKAVKFSRFLWLEELEITQKNEECSGKIIALIGLKKAEEIINKMIHEGESNEY